LNCRLASATLRLLPEPNVRSKDRFLAKIPKRLSKCERRILELLKRHPEGLTLRQISIRLGISARHAHRCLHRLHKRGLVNRLIDFRLEHIVRTDLKHSELVEVAHRWLATPKS